MADDGKHSSEVQICDLPIPAGIHKQFASLCKTGKFQLKRGGPRNISGCHGANRIKDEWGVDFNEKSAMHWIRAQLENSVTLCPKEEIINEAWFQDETTGATLYEFTAAAFQDGQLIYVKVQHIKNMLLVWSFHASTTPILSPSEYENYK